MAWFPCNNSNLGGLSQLEVLWKNTNTSANQTSSITQNVDHTKYEAVVVEMIYSCTNDNNVSYIETRELIKYNESFKKYSIQATNWSKTISFSNDMVTVSAPTSGYEGMMIVTRICGIPSISALKMEEVYSDTTSSNVSQKNVLLDEKYSMAVVEIVQSRSNPTITSRLLIHNNEGSFSACNTSISRKCSFINNNLFVSSKSGWEGNALLQKVYGIETPII